ncbi:MAG: HAMP domain-containing histidine kinase [Planctomycetes bacterium]|nr:HAMP domain-containing histidine kinase [Planctomycetota bacterium]
MSGPDLRNLEGGKTDAGTTGMSIRSRIVLVVLLFGISEAVLLGVVGFNSVRTISRNAAELRRILAAIDGTRDLTVGLSQLGTPEGILRDAHGGGEARFSGRIADLQGRIAGCMATSCHGYAKRPADMASHLRDELGGIRTRGLEILRGRDPSSGASLDAWSQGVDASARRLTQATGQMSTTLNAKATEIESALRQTEKTALLLVTFSTVSCILVALVLCHPVARSIARPIDALAGQAWKITDGDLSARAREEGPREVVSLACLFNRMMDDLVRQQRDLLQHQEHLEREVNLRIAELRRKDEEVQRSGRLAGIGLIAGAVAHDLNNPLTNIILNSEALLRGVPPGDASRPIVEDIERDARRCRVTTLAVRSLGRENEFANSRCEIDALAREAIHLLRHRWEPRRLSLTCRFQPEPFVGEADPSRLLQVFLNLIDNAIDASPDGGFVEVRGFAGGDAMVLEVEDSGPGIPVAERPDLFRPLHTTKKDGTGLGLAICKRIVEQHAGVIDLKERVPDDAARSRTGAVFRIRMPWTRDREGPCQPGHPS